jgi:hypothetical protein
VFVTAGNQHTRDDDGSHHVPKKSLIGTLLVLLESRRLQISGGTPLADGLAKELSSFAARGRAGRTETFEGWQEIEQDDRVLAVALAGWIAKRTPPTTENGIPVVIGLSGSVHLFGW